ncbi:TetR family transcriptional regulator [Streptomyces sp. Root63]|uniref:TetR/AcrR family transcriptional regulator n=1 Tax=unclassified Streptomyces TaxID=2593676 RepID=UPI0006F864D4|nr:MULTISPECIES: helix-turn-helix domain-containing protein [unclassified Streptomyces]KQX41756.1 TetR family transcriptional regulator [Streptomyces sp. Root1295]KRA30646.1 TetR family transcriptional regulator [Streptomyces sp. Root63]
MSDRRTAILEAAATVIARRGVRGLRVEELAVEAGVSKALIYYHFEDRTGLLRRTLAFVNNRAERYTAEQSAADAAAGPDTVTDPGAPTDPGTTAGAAPTAGPLRRLEQALLLELQDLPHVRENSTAWGELRASAVFDPELRGELALASVIWVREVADQLGEVRPTAPESALTASAERLTALLEGLSARWLSGILPLADARTRMREAIGVEVAHLAGRVARLPADGMPTSSPKLD